MKVVSPGICWIEVNGDNSGDDDDRFKIIVEIEGEKTGNSAKYVAVYEPATIKGGDWSQDPPAHVVSDRLLLFTALRMSRKAKDSKVKPQSVVATDGSILVRVVVDALRGFSFSKDCTNTYVYYYFHKKSATPKLTAGHLWNCSVAWLGQFQQHLGLCDLITECYGG
ncbi:hypothetical protein ACOMHN_031041 [Nucella lapillus]